MAKFDLKKMNKWFYAFAGTAVALIAAVIVAIVVGVGPKTPAPTPETPLTEGAETGVYYYDVAEGEVVLSLHGGNKFTIAGPGYNKSGEYTINGSSIAFDFFRDEDGTATANLNGGNLAFTDKDGKTTQYLKKVPYVVTFNTNGGSAVDKVTVINGKTVGAPADPAKDGNVFLGWYADEAFKTPYNFGATAIYANTTIYAKWAETGDAPEYALDFVISDDGSVAGTMATIGGKLVFGTNYREPKREGYTFAGWYVSMTENGDKLSYEVKEGDEFKSDATIYAVWSDNNAALAAPLVSVDAVSIKWNNANDVNVSYTLKITSVADGNVIFNGDVSGTVKAFDFYRENAGEYMIELTATKGSETATTVRYYSNKTLDMVYKFSVIDGKVLVFGAVENAEKYIITVNCGNPEHNHTNFDNGASTVFNFANCSMQKDGITFTVTAKAEGYASSVSKTFVYVKNLDAVTGLAYNDANGTFTWNAVDNAAKYYVTVTVGEESYTFDNGGKTSFSTNGYTGEITVSVVPATEGYNSPEGTKATVTKTKLATPANVNVNGVTVAWDAVEGATGYVVKVNGIDLTTAETSVSLINDKITLTAGESYTITVVAVSTEAGVEESFASEAVNAKYLEMSGAVKYYANTVSWNAVMGATKYEVMVNDGTAIEVENANSVEVTLTKAGTNTIAVRCADLGSNAKWTVVEVYAYEVNYISRSLENSDVTEYVAVGDKMLLPEGYELLGYDFTGWYNSPSAANGNGAKYNETVFVGNGDLTLYANWTPKEYGIHVVVDDTITNMTNETVMSATYTKDFFMTPAVSSDATRGGFIGWFTLPGGAGVQLTDAEGNSLAPYSETKDIVAYPFFDTQVLAYTLKNDGTYAAHKGPNVNSATNVKIPTTYKGIAVTSILENAFASCTTIETIEFPESIALVGTGAFNGCSSLTSITVYEVEGYNGEVLYSSDNGALIYFDAPSNTYYLEFFPRAKTGTYTVPENVETIRTNAFIYSNVEHLIISKGVTTIAAKAFNSCRALISITFETGRENNVTISDGAFVACTTIKEINLPAKIAQFDYKQFSELTALEKITVEEGCTLYGATNGMLTNATQDTIIFCPVAYNQEITFPSNIKTIDEAAFAGLAAVENIVIPASLNTIGKGAFEGCLGLKTVTVNGKRNNPLTIGENAFAKCPSLESVVFEGNADETDAGATTIGKGAFEANAALTTLTIKNGANIAMIGESAFANNTMLSNLVFEDNAVIKAIGAYAFKGIIIREFVIHPSTENIGNYAFADCSLLASLSFAPNGKEIKFGDYVFSNCTRLTKIQIPANVTNLDGSVFNGCDAINEIVVDPANTALKAIDGVLYDYNVTRIKFYPLGLDGDLSVLPWNTLTHIESSVFKNNPKIKSVNIGKNIVYIGEGAFEKCINLKDITFAPEIGAFEIDNAAFKGCVALENITIPAGTTKIGAEAFYMTELKAITVPASVSYIGNYAFAYTKLETIALPEALTFLGDGAFASCTLLSNVTIAGGNTPLAIGTVENTDPLAGVFAKTAITKIVIPDRTTVIGAYAFADATTLTELTLSTNANVTAIGAYAFSNTAFTAFPMLPKLETIGDFAFSGSKIESIKIAKTVTTIGKSAFADSALAAIEFELGGDDPLTIKDLAFKNNKFTEITLPARTAKLNDIIVINKVASNYYEIDGAYNVFNGNTVLENIHVEAGGAVYGSFDGVLCYVTDGVPTEILFCPEGKTGKLVVPNTITYLRAHAFNGTHLSELIFEEFDKNDANYGKPILRVGDRTTNNDSRMWVIYPVSESFEVTFPSHLDYIGSYGVTSKTNGKSVKAIHFNPDSEIELTANCLIANSGLKELILPKVKGKIGKTAVSGATSLEKVTFGEGSTFTAIEDSVFQLSTSGYDNFLTTITIPKSVKTIGGTVFSYRSALTEVKFEEGSEVTSFGNLVFRGCGLTTFTFPSTTTTLGNRIFDQCANLTEINLSANITTVLANASLNVIADNAPSLRAVNVDPANTSLKSVDGVVYDYAMSTLMFFPHGKAGEGFVMPESVTAIGNMAFRYYKGNCIDLGSNITSIGNYAFYYAENLTAVHFPKTLKTMGTYTFYACKSLASVTFEEGCALTSVGNYAFYNCTALVEIDLPDNITTYGTHMFYGCASLEKVTLSAAAKSLSNNMFYNCKALKTVILQEGITTFGTNVFGYSGLEYITIPSTVTSIGASVFAGCENFSSIEFAPHSKLTSLGNYVFQKTALAAITLPEKVTTLGTGLFQAAVNLKSVDMGDSAIKSLPKNIFSGCSGLESIVLPEVLESILDAAFGPYSTSYPACISLTSITIPASVKTIGNGAFNGCTALETVIFEGDNITSIGNSTTAATTVFKDTTSLKSITIPASVVSIGHSAFENSGITEVVFEGNVEAIGAYAFKNCASLETANLPASVADIGEGAFYGCKNLAGIELQFGLETIGNYAFGECSLIDNITIPASVEEIGDNPFLDCASLKNFSLDADNVNFRFINGVLYDKDMFTLIYYSAANADEVCTIPENVMEIGNGAFAGAQFKKVEYPERFHFIPDYAFKNCTNLVEVVIPKSIETIGAHAFEGCKSLAVIDIPNTVNSMGDYIFAECTALETVNYEERKVNIAIGQYAFLNCENITYLAIPTDFVAAFSVGMFSGTGLVEVYIPDNLPIDVERIFENCKSLVSVTFSENYTAQKLGSYLFQGCSSLKSFTIPAGVYTTGIYCFADCTSLESITFHEDVYMISSYSFYNCTSLKTVISTSTFMHQVANYAFANCTALETVVFENLSEIYNYAFKNCVSLKEFTVNDNSLNTIYIGAFENCTSLTELHIYSPSMFDANAIDGWTENQTIYLHGFESLDAAVLKLGVWLKECAAKIVVLPE